MKVDKTELVYKLLETINSIAEEKNPGEEMIAMGNALSKIGKIIKDVPYKTAKSAIMTLKFMNDSGLMEKDEVSKGEIKVL